jgi:hypothetical protein
MTKRIYVPMILLVLTIVTYIPNVTLAQNGPPAQVQTDQTGRKVPRPQGGIATVIGVDQPDNCLRIRSGPGSSYDVIGCADMGQQLNITGVWTSNDWAQLANNGWVYGPQIQTDLRPPPLAYSQPQNYVVIEDQYPVYDDVTYLPDYGYTTYWYGGVPIFLYSANVWFRHHPWWWHKGWRRDHSAWNRGSNFRAGVRTGTRRNFVPNRSILSSPNISRFNSTRFRSGSLNPIRTGRTFANPNAMRSLSTSSSPNTIRMRNSGVRSFSTGGFNARTLNAGRFGTRSINAVRGGGFSGVRVGGGGLRMGGGGNFSGAVGGGRRR